MHCYVYRTDSRFEKDSRLVTKNADFDLPVRLSRDGTYKLQPDGEPVYTCFTSDFFLDKADAWRDECWQMIHRRPDLDFLIITKRIVRFAECVPADWGEGYGNVTICCTVENEEEAKRRLPIFLEAKIRRAAQLSADEERRELLRRHLTEVKRSMRLLDRGPHLPLDREFHLVIQQVEHDACRILRVLQDGHHGHSCVLRVVAVTGKGDVDFFLHLRPPS